MVALVLQFLLYNSDTVGSLNPTANNHIQTTSFTLQVHSYTLTRTRARTRTFSSGCGSTSNQVHILP